MKFIFTLLLGFFICIQNGKSQSYSVGTQTITFTDASRANRKVATDLYYPADNPGNGVPLASGTDSFPVVVFGHGYLIPTSAYEWLADSLVKQGYIVAFPSTGGELFPSHTDFGNDLFFLCNYIPSLNDQASSFLYHRVTKRAAVAGHSMGGGCSFLAAAKPSDVIKAIFNFAAAETNPSAIAAASSVDKVALVFSGSSDCIAPPAQQQQMYENVTASCKSYLDITGAIHCQFANNNGTCALGQLASGCNSSPVIPAIVFEKVTTVLIPFLDYYLKNNCARGTDYLDVYNNLTGADKKISCTSITPCSVLPITLQSFNAAISGKRVTLNWKISGQDHLSYFELERSPDGSSFQPFEKINNTPAADTYQYTDAHPFPGTGYYRVLIYNRDGSYTSSNIVTVSMPGLEPVVVSVLPNPVVNTLTISLSVVRTGKYTVSVTDMTGKRRYANQYNLTQGNSSLQVPATGLAAGVYVLTVESTDGTRQKVRFVKGN